MTRCSFSDVVGNQVKAEVETTGLSIEKFDYNSLEETGKTGNPSVDFDFEASAVLAVAVSPIIQIGIFEKGNTDGNTVEAFAGVMYTITNSAMIQCVKHSLRCKTLHDGSQ